MSRSTFQRGFSLIELMIAMLIGLFLVSGLIYVYIGSKTSYNYTEGLSRLQENGRFAVGFLSRDLRAAGYMSCAKNVGRIKSTLNQTEGYNWDFDQPIEGYDDSEAPFPSTLPAVVTDNWIPGTDIIAIRKVANTELPVLQHNGPSADIKVVDNVLVAESDIVLATDCKDAAIFQITSINTSQGFNLVHNEGQGTGKIPGNFTKDLGKDFEDDGKVLLLQTITYYLADGVSPGVPSLWRLVNDDNAEELVSGVEDMQILYGEDTNVDRAADIYVTADNVANMDNVVSVRIALLLSTIEGVAPESIPYSFTVYANATPGDRRLRREFLATVNIRNRTP